MFPTHVNHVSVSPTNGIGTTQGQRKTLTSLIKPESRRFNSHPGQSFSLSLCDPNFIIRANAHMVYMGRKQHFTLPYNSLDNDVISDLSYGVISGHLSRPMNIKENF